MEDCPGETPPYFKDFIELTSAQKLAVAELGCSWSMWDNDDYPSKYRPY